MPVISLASKGSSNNKEKPHRNPDTNIIENKLNFVYVDFVSIILDHIIDWNKATILSTEKDYTKHLFAESWLINNSSNVMNKNDGNTLPSVYKKLL